MMQRQNNRKMWQAPWGYSESFAIVGGIIIIGLLLQINVGSFDFYLLASPINYIVGLIITLLSIVLGIKYRNGNFSRWFSSLPLSVAILSAMLLLSIIMGLTPQMSRQTSRVGLEMMTANWSFVMLYTLLLISLGATIIKRLLKLQIKDIPFHINHIGLWLLLFASGLSYADMQRYVMYVNEGETEWRVYDKDQNIHELPIAITLNDFSMEFYPSHEIIVNIETGEVLQTNNSDDIVLGDKYRRVMSSPEPRAFRSDIEVYTKDGESLNAIIEVNKPVRVGAWNIYQYGYDNEAGNRSTYSSFELVYDRWITLVYIGIIMMMTGAITLIWNGRKIGRREYGME